MSFSLKPKEVVYDDDSPDYEYVIKGAKFKRVIADADTPLFQAAKSIQEDYVVVTHLASGRKKEFKNVTSFYGHHSKKAGGWLAEVNAEREKEGKPLWSVDEFEIEAMARLSPVPKGYKDPMDVAMRSFDSFVGKLKRAVEADTYLLCIGGEGNFRYEMANILKYKGERPEKPLMFYEIKEAVIQKYGKYIEVVDGEEADDRLGQYGWQNYLNHRMTGEWDDCLAYVDKDLDMIISPSFNYNKVEDGLTYTTPLMAAKCFCAQLLSGDKAVDNIQGLPNLTEEVCTKYGLGKTRGVGKATALKLLEGCGSIKEMFERVVEAYKSYYGEEYTFTSYKDEELTWSWLDFLRENAILLWMRRSTGEVYEIEDTLTKLKVEF